MVKRILNRLHVEFLKFSLKQNKKIILKGDFHLNGKPLIQVMENALITIGDNVTLNSGNKDYHINMFAPVKLLADRPGAKIIIGNNTRIHGSCIHAWSSIEIGSNCLIAANCQISDSNGHETLMDIPHNRIKSQDKPKPIKIDNNVWIGTGAIILPGITIGEGSIVAAGSVVTKNVPNNVIVGGNPAKILRNSRGTH